MPSNKVRAHRSEGVPNRLLPPLAVNSTCFGHSKRHNSSLVRVSCLARVISGWEDPAEGALKRLSKGHSYEHLCPDSNGGRKVAPEDTGNFWMNGPDGLRLTVQAFVNFPQPRSAKQARSSFSGSS